MDPVLRTEVEDNLRIDHPDLFATFLGKIPQLAETMAAVLQSCSEAEPRLFREDVGWVHWSAACKEASVLEFLRGHIDRFLICFVHYNVQCSTHNPLAMRNCQALLLNIGS